MSTDTKYLIILPAGISSLHKPWILHDECKYEILLIDYSKNGVHDNGKHKYYFKAQGPKWIIVKEAIEAFEEEISKYEYIWIPDDDIFIHQKNIVRIFKLAEKYNLSIAQPALSIDSYYSFRFTTKVPMVETRITNFVEIMAPLFRTEVLLEIKHSFDFIKSGWGIDYYCQKYASEKNLLMGVIDKYDITHTRPINIFVKSGYESNKSGFYKEYNVNPHEELATFLKHFEIKPKVPKTLKAYMTKYLRIPAGLCRIQNKRLS